MERKGPASPPGFFFFRLSIYTPRNELAMADFFSHDNLGTIGQWVAAGATFTAAIVALFKDSFLAWWRKPELTVEPELRKDLFPYEDKDGNLVHYGYNFRLAIKNDGKTKAEKVEVFAAKLEKFKNGRFLKEPFFPMNLTWAHDDESHRDWISPTTTRLCNLGRLLDPNRPNAGRSGSQGTVLELHVQVTPTTRTNHLSSGTYRLYLEISASNCKLIQKTLEIMHSGKWFDNEHAMYKDGITFRFVDE